MNPGVASKQRHQPLLSFDFGTPNNIQPRVLPP